MAGKVIFSQSNVRIGEEENRQIVSMKEERHWHRTPVQVGKKGNILLLSSFYFCTLLDD
jgi:hypothetical protein